MKAALAFLACAAMSSAANASIVPPLLAARPSPAAGSLAAGETPLANGATVYRPRSAPAGPLPLVVLLHGAGGYPVGFLKTMEPVADQRGVLLLEPHSLGRTWDLAERMGQGEQPWGGPDARRLDQSLAELFRRAAVDPSRVVLLGFSDGASYALSLGLANPKLFTAVVALSPGVYAPPWRIAPAQRVFIAHGRRDHVLPFAASSDIAKALRGQGSNVRFRPFNGDHQIDGSVLIEGLEWALGGAAF